MELRPLPPKSPQVELSKRAFLAGRPESRGKHFRKNHFALLDSPKWGCRVHERSEVHNEARPRGLMDMGQRAMAPMHAIKILIFNKQTGTGRGGWLNLRV